LEVSSEAEHHLIADGTSLRNLNVSPYAPFLIIEKRQDSAPLVIIGAAEAVRIVRADAVEDGVAALWPRRGGLVDGGAAGPAPAKSGG
jgi:hypothetical protein